MSQAIRIALIVAAIASVIAVVANLLPEFTGLARNSYNLVNNSIVALVPYMSWARRLLNALIGNNVITSALISIIIIFPFTYFMTGIVTRIYRLIIGQ